MDPILIFLLNHMSEFESLFFCSLHNVSLEVEETLFVGWTVLSSVRAKVHDMADVVRRRFPR